MLKRFSLYGFLKNQRYFEPFIILFFLQQGLSFTEIGFLIAFREIFINLLEIPSGAVADLFGRRRSMMLSFIAYIISFAIFGFSGAYWHFYLAMFFFAIGEAFRTGTHKAMIFTWLRIQGRTDEKTQVYGYTRSWSKIGSGVSTVIAVVLVFIARDYSWIFLFAIIPYLAGLINFFWYPKELEGQPEEKASFRTVIHHLWECLKNSLSISPLRRLMIESMSFEGVFKAVENYLQPFVQNMALMLPLFTGIGDTRRSAIMIGVVYVILYLGSAYASRMSHRLSHYAGGETEGGNLCWKLVFIIYLALIPLLVFELYWAAIIGFIFLTLIQNFWRPMLISRFDSFASETEGATILSIESQVKSAATMVVAPVMGASVDFLIGRNLGGQFWPVAAIGGIVALAIILTAGRRKSGSS
ncbi:MFS transporter [Chloroflexota bacterium]